MEVANAPLTAWNTIWGTFLQCINKAVLRNIYRPTTRMQETDQYSSALHCITGHRSHHPTARIRDTLNHLHNHFSACVAEFSVCVCLQVRLTGHSSGHSSALAAFLLRSHDFMRCPVWQSSHSFVLRRCGHLSLKLHGCLWPANNFVVFGVNGARSELCLSFE